MATKEMMVCDVYGSHNDVQRYRVNVELKDDPPAPAFSADLDLCPRALRRLIAFIERGTSPPSAKKEGESNG